MIEIAVTSNGEVVARAETDDPEAAILAARTLWDDYFRLNPRTAGAVETTFEVAGRLVRKIGGRA